jgi:hypothetical protein
MTEQVKAIEPDDQEHDDSLPFLEMAQPIAISAEDIGEDNSRDLHVCRLGKLYDLSSGELILELDEDSARELAATSNAMIEAGHVMPISFEHGIEQAQRGVDGADPRPYGEISRVYYDEERQGIYAVKKWTKLGMVTLSAAVTEEGGTAYRVSPRICFSKAYHPTTGEVLGDRYIDVIALTTMPRTSGLSPVHLSRQVGEDTQIPTKCADEAQETTPSQSAGQTQQEPPMADNTEATVQEVEILLARGTEEAGQILSALDLDVEAPSVELARRIQGIKTELDEAKVELSRYREEEIKREQVIREAKVDATLDTFEIPEGSERLLFRANLLSSEKATVELAMAALEQRETPDKAELIDNAITAAKERGALTADYVLTDELRELAGQGTDLAVNLINAIPAGNTVRIGEAAGSDNAGVDVTPAVNSADAEKTLSRLARTKRQSGEATTMIEAWELAREERPELAAIVYGEQ